MIYDHGYLGLPSNVRVIMCCVIVCYCVLLCIIVCYRMLLCVIVCYCMVYCVAMCMLSGVIVNHK